MPLGIGGGGFMGLAFEAVYGTYVAPTRYFPIRSESLKFIQETQWRRTIRGIVDMEGAIAGNVRIEGDIEMEALTDILPYFLYAGRTSVVKTGAGTPWTYTAKGTASAEGTALRSLSLTVVRAGVVFGYTGCRVGSFRLRTDNGQLLANFSILGSDEASQSLPTYAGSTQPPFGAGLYDIEIPTATDVFDMDDFEFSVEDNAEAQYRLKSTGRGAQFIKFGERDVQLTTERDFTSRTEYDAFKALTAQSITLKAIKDANQQITILMPNTIKDEYVPGNLSGQGDLIRAQITYRPSYDVTLASPYSVAIICTENIV
jgi:hypothetical protein